MRSRIFGFITALTVVFGAGALLAQDAAPVAEPAKKEAPKTEVKGKIYGGYVWQTNTGDGSKAINAFTIDRAYVTVQRKLGDGWKVRVRSDVDPDLGDGQAVYYLKHAYVEKKMKFSDAAKLKVQMGLTGTPIIGYVDDQSGYRWIYNNFFDKAKSLDYDETGFGDNSADAGLMAKLTVAKMVNITLGMTEGEGYKNLDEMGEAKKNGKAFYGVANIEAVEGVFINAFTRYEQSELEVSGGTETNEMYYGGGVGIDMMGIKAGVNAGMGNATYDGDDYSNLMLIDSYLNANLQEFAGMPVLVLGRFAYAKESEKIDLGAGAVEYDAAIYWGAGLGYKLHKKVQAAVFFENYSFDSDYLKDPKQNVYIKVEAKY